MKNVGASIFVLKLMKLIKIELSLADVSNTFN